MANGIFITGAGRSGTSMVAGLFARSGRFMGENLHSPRVSNPKGFFESPQINGLNETILLPYLPKPFVDKGIDYGADAPRRTHTWLARLPADLQLQADGAVKAGIAALIAEHPLFCFKDPRFAYTLPHWTGACGPDYKVICVFRDPAIVVESILQEIHSQPYLHDFAASVSQLFEHWAIVYERLLAMSDSRWFFISYDDTFNSNTLDRLEDFAGTRLDRSFPEASLNRSRLSLPAPAICSDLLDRLRQRTHFSR